MEPQQSFVRRTLSALLAVMMGANGLVMLVAGRWWYGAVPGVTGTGPFNPHFVKDIGAEYLVVGAALGWLAARPGQLARGAVVAGAAFLLLHAGVHVADAFADHHGLGDLGRDFPGVFLPAFIAAWLAVTPYSRLETRHAQSLA